ncbi:TetR/AcrR family transcriptional regulator [Actinophytocola xinjiangensis]|nr:TetR/AcrR family transcriptional regulator [Actinophytocola xinjiangensis]
MTNANRSMREKILETVTELFIHKGFHGTGVQEISKAVNLGRGALYYHIGSKEQILFDISMSLLRSALDTTLPFVDTDDPPDVKLHNIARALLRHHATHGEGWQVAVREARFLSEEYQQQVIDARREFEQLWHRVLQEGARAGLWRAVDAVDVRGVLGMFNYTARWMRADGPLSPEQIADRYVDLLLTGLIERSERSERSDRPDQPEPPPE